MVRKKIILCISPLLVFLFCSCSGEVDPSFLFEEKTPPPESTLAKGETVEFYSYLPHGKEMYINSGTALFDLESQKIQSEEVFFEHWEEESIQLQAGQGIFDLKTQQFEFYNDVIYHGEQGSTLFTDQLAMDNLNNIISTHQEFELHTGTGRISGKGFEATRRLTDINIKSAYGHEGNNNVH